MNELQRTEKCLQPRFDEDAWRILDIVARRLHEARSLPQLRQHAPGPFGQGRVRKDHLSGDGGADYFGVELRVALPGARMFEFEHAPLDIVGHHWLFGTLDRSEVIA